MTVDGSDDSKILPEGLEEYDVPGHHLSLNQHYLLQ